MNILRNILFLILLSPLNIIGAQEISELKIDNLIYAINWGSVPMDCQGLSLVITEDDMTSNHLVRIGSSATEKLIEALLKEEKTVAIHIILTRIYDSDAYENAWLQTNHIRKNCTDFIGYHHVFAGIYWDWISNEDTQIPPSEIQKISAYWKNKLIDKKVVALPSDKSISDKLIELDKIKYPCK